MKRAGAGLAASALVGCGGGGAAHEQAQTGSPNGDYRGETLRIFVYAGFHEQVIREVFIPMFEARTGARVVLDPGWWDSIPKLKAAPPDQPPFDLVATDATQGIPGIREGLFQTIDRGNIGNLEKLAAPVRDNWIVRDGYGVTTLGSQMALAYHRELVPFEPAGWLDLLRPEVAGAVGLYNSFYMSLYTFACAKVANEGRAGTAAAEMVQNLAGVVDFAQEWRKQVKIWWTTSTDMALNLVERNCALGNMHSPELLLTLRQKPELGAVVPRADRAFVQGIWVVPAGTRKKRLAEAAIDLLIGEEVQREFARRGSPTSIPSVARAMAEADPLWRQIYPATEEELASAQYYPYEVYFQNWDWITRVWDQRILRGPSA